MGYRGASTSPFLPDRYGTLANQARQSTALVSGATDFGAARFRRAIGSNIVPGISRPGPIRRQTEDAPRVVPGWIVDPLAFRQIDLDSFER